MNTQKLIFTNALRIYLGIVGFYLIMKFLGLAHLLELRIFNILFVIYGTNKAIKTNIFENHNSDYLTNLSVGFSTSLIAILSVIASMILYVNLISDDLLILLQNSSFWGHELTLQKVVFALTIEALASCVIGTFTLMQYWKKYEIKSLKD